MELPCDAFIIPAQMLRVIAPPQACLYSDTWTISRQESEAKDSIAVDRKVCFPDIMGYSNRLMSHQTQSCVVKETDFQLGKPMGVTVFCHPELNPFLNTTTYLPSSTVAGMPQMPKPHQSRYTLMGRATIQTDRQTDKIERLQ